MRNAAPSTGQFSFGGVRTYPLIGLIAYGISLLSGGEILPVTLGFAVVAGFLMLSYRNKLQSGTAGVTSEMSALTTYVAAALVYREQFWIATTLTVASMLLLELKSALEGLTQRIAQEEILTFTKFLLLTAVILPVLPNREFGPFAINPASNTYSSQVPQEHNHVLLDIARATTTRLSTPFHSLWIMRPLRYLHPHLRPRGDGRILIRAYMPRACRRHSP